MAEPARTRRSARTASTPVVASDGTYVSRAELRRRATGPIERPAIVWGRAQDAAARAADKSQPVTGPTTVASEAASSASGVAATNAPAVQPRGDAATASTPRVDAATASTSRADAVPAPLSRRARRLRTGQTPIIPAPTTEAVRSIADAAYPASPETEQISTASIALPATESLSLSTDTVPVAPGSEPEGAEQRKPEQPTPVSTARPEPATQATEIPPSTSKPQSKPEPRVEPEPRAEHATSADEAPIDEFEAAARLFSFTGETPVQRDGEELIAERIVAGEAPAEPAASPKKKHKASRRAHTSRTSLKRMAAASVSLGAIVAVGLLAVGTTMPAEAVASADTRLTGATMAQRAGDVTASADDGEIQAYVAPGDSEPVAGELHRSGNYSTATLVEMAGTTGISNVSSSVFTNNPLCDVQWPFAVGVSISYGFGPRPGEFHEGVDFTPGYGAHVQAIADGTVRVAQEGYQGYGVAVIIDHVIDGQHVASLYGHMQYGSLQVRPGEHVKVGQYIGRTGNTGYSFGAHTHVEIRQNGVTPIDPLPWLRAHNQC